MTVDLQTIVLAVFGTLGAAAVGVLGFLLRSSWSDIHKKVDELKTFVGQSIDDLYKTKADNGELTRVRDAHISIFDKMGKHESEDHATHGQILQSMGRLEGKMDALLARKRGSD